MEVVEYDRTEEGRTLARRSPDRQRVKIGVVARRVQQQIPEMVLHQPEQAATDAMGATPTSWHIKPEEAVTYPIRSIQQQDRMPNGQVERMFRTIKDATVKAVPGSRDGEADKTDMETVPLLRWGKGQDVA